MCIYRSRREMGDERRMEMDILDNGVLDGVSNVLGSVDVERPHAITHVDSLARHRAKTKDEGKWHIGKAVVV